MKLLVKGAAAPRLSGALGKYLAELAGFPLLSAEEEQRLARAYRSNGERGVSHRLVTANLRFVVKVAREYRAYGIALPDLIQEGNIGLMTAVERFDPDKGVRLISYAVWWIRAAIQDYILRSWSLVKIGTTQSQRSLFFSLARIRREIERVSIEGGLGLDGADSARIAERVNAKQSEVEEMTWRLASRDTSLDVPRGEGERSFHDLLADDGPQQDHELSVAQEEALVRGRVDEALSRLLERERHIIEQHVMREPPLPLSEIGAELEISPQRSLQLESRARKKLRKDLSGLAAEIGWRTQAAPRGPTDRRTLAPRGRARPNTHEPLAGKAPANRPALGQCA